MAQAEAMSFGALLRRLRLAAGLTQEGLAERAGVSAGAVSDLERNPTRLPRLDSVALLADALRGINPRLAQGGRLLMPVTMSLFGMLNWQHLWFRPDGPMTREAYADLVTQMMVDGIAGLGEARRKLGQRVGV